MAWMWWLLAPVGSTLVGAVWLWRPTLPPSVRRRWRSTAPMAEHRRLLDALPGAAPTGGADPERSHASNVLLLSGPLRRPQPAADPLSESEASAS